MLAVARDLCGPLDQVGSFARPPRGAWSGCDDLGGQVAYRVSGRLDAPDGSSDGFLDSVRRRLADIGLELRAESAAADPVTLHGDRHDVLVRLTGYTGKAVVVLSLTGPCLDVGDSDDDLLAEPPVRLSVT